MTPPYSANIGVVSVIMAARNSEGTIREAISSALSQTYKNLELIVVDDASEDGTAAVARDFAERDSRVKVISNSSAQGASLSRLRALWSSCGNWVAILDSDDAWEPEKLELQAGLQLATGADVVYTGSAFMRGDGVRLSWTFEVPESVTYGELLGQNVISNSSALVRRHLYERFYAIGDGIHEDYAVWLRILAAGHSARGVNLPLLVYRVSPDSKSGDKGRSARMNWKTYRYVGLGPVASARHMALYAANGLRKHAAIRSSADPKRSLFGKSKTPTGDRR